jgi:hypothetical protein
VEGPEPSETATATVAPPRLPDALILGAAKAGTTSLAAWLGAHPDVHVPPQKEIHFFSHRWEMGLAWYASELGETTKPLVVEASPEYLAHPDAAGRIAEVLPDAKLIALLREPADRAWSHYWYDHDLGLRELPTFEELAAAAGTADEHDHLEQGRYGRHLERYSATVPRDRLLVLWFDDLRDHPERTWREVCAFLGIDADPVPASVGSVHNKHYTIRFPAVRRFMLRQRAWRRWPFGLARRIDRFVRAEQDNPEMDADVRQQLRAAFADDRQALEAWLGRPVPAGWR